jgi:hypothetical protein
VAAPGVHGKMRAIFVRVRILSFNPLPASKLSTVTQPPPPLPKYYTKRRSGMRRPHEAAEERGFLIQGALRPAKIVVGNDLVIRPRGCGYTTLPCKAQGRCTAAPREFALLLPTKYPV